MKLLGALPVAVALVLALAGCDTSGSSGSSGSAGSDSAIRIAAVGDMNGVGPRPVLGVRKERRRDRRGAEGADGRCVPRSRGLPVRRRALRGLRRVLEHPVGWHEDRAVLDQRAEPRLGTRTQRGSRQLHERPVSRGHHEISSEPAEGLDLQRRPVLLRPRQLALRDAQLGAMALLPGPGRRATRWLDEDLAAAKEKGRHLVVAYHEPYFTSDTDEHTPAEEAKPWIDVIDKYDVRLTLSGSQHNYERSCPVRPTARARPTPAPAPPRSRCPPAASGCASSFRRPATSSSGSATPTAG